MSQSRRFHGPGQGGRTGLRVGQDVDSLSGYLEAGRKAIRLGLAAQRDDDDDDEDDDDEPAASDEDEDQIQTPESLYEDSMSQIPSTSMSNANASRRQSSAGPSQSRTAANAGRQSGLGSSSMDLENSYAPSPRRPNGSRSSRSSAEVFHDPDDTGDGSVIDYGPGGSPSYANEDNEDRGVGPSGRPSMAPSTPGVGRRRMSDALGSSPGRPRLSNMSAILANDDEPMDFGNGDDYPEMSIGQSPNPVDQHSSPRALAEEQEDSYQAGLAETGEGDSGRPAEEQSPVQAPRKRGRPPKNAQRAKGKEPGANGRQLPSTFGENRVIERIPSSRGKAGTVMDGDVRRSTRHRISPLDWWRGERAVYGRPSSSSRRKASRSDGDGDEEGAREGGEDDGDVTVDPDTFEDAPVRKYEVPVLKSVIRVARAPGEGTFSGMKMPLKGKRAGKNGRGSFKARKKAKRDRDDDEEGEEVEIELDPQAPTRHPEDTWDDNTETHGVVWDVEQRTELHRKIACPTSKLRTRMATDSSFAFDKVFALDEFMAAGILEIPVGGEKPLKPTKDNNYVFSVVEGAIDVQIHRTFFRLAPGGMFAVPKGNLYAVRNISQRTAKIFFAQSRQPKRLTASANDTNLSSTATAADETQNVNGSSSSNGRNEEAQNERQTNRSEEEEDTAARPSSSTSAKTQKKNKDDGGGAKSKSNSSSVDSAIGSKGKSKGKSNKN
ncbi:unnamed protein product [Sympodiomycopsis kandeliae]